ncbi:MAG: hypothetical protein V4537_12090 [Pseudomonadota bacterium]
MVTLAALLLWLTLLVAPETPIGGAIHRWTVAKPAARLNRITRGQVLFVLLLVTGASLVGWLIGHEAGRLMAMGLPELAIWATMFEVTAYLDTIAAIVTAASAMRFAGIKARVRAVFTPRRPMARAPRARPRRVEPANDDEDSWAGRAMAS